MPIDINSIVKKSTNHVANQTILGGALANPCYVGLIITIILICILRYHNFKGLCFKFIFYTAISIIGVMVVHDVVIRDRMNEKVEASVVSSIVSAHVDNPIQSGIGPRNDIDAVRGGYIKQEMGVLPVTHDEMIQALSVDTPNHPLEYPPTQF
jgi:hypothetical protein